MTEGWYARVITKQTPNVRWISISEYWFNIYTSKKDKTPLLALHTSKLMISDETDEYSNSHSFKIVINHTCAQRSITIITPNQFDIIEIREKLQVEIDRWSKLAATAAPELPHQFVMDSSGKFIYRNVDRIYVNVVDDGIEINQEGKETIKIHANSTFDVYPTLETERDPRWVAITSNTGSQHLHCQTFEDSKLFVHLCLLMSSRINNAAA